MFWGLVLKTNKRYSQQVSKAFHVSQAVLDLGTVNPNDEDAVVQVWLNTDDTDHLIANVGRKTSHVQLDLTFTVGETVAFYSKGSGTVHLTGYLIPDEDDFGDFPPYGEEEESDEEVEAPPNKQKADKKVKRAKVDDDEEDDDDDEDDSDLDSEALQGMLDDDEGEDEEDSDDDDDDDEDDDDDDDEDDEDDSDEITAPQSKKAKLENAGKQNGLTNGKVPKKELEKQKNQQKTQKQDKQQEQKQKQQQQQQQKKPTPKTLKGGVIVEDLRVGKGAEAQAGKKVFVYYEGRLKSNNKLFDSTKSGEGFKFTLGRGEVIQGWDIGVVGMKVGSKRRITCPPNVAYGHKGAPPQIPGNSTLVFDVELRNIK